MKNVKETVKSFLVRNFRKEDLADDLDFFAAGIANSLFSMQLIMFLENEFDITVENEEMELVNFSSLNNITAFVEGKLK